MQQLHIIKIGRKRLTKRFLFDIIISPHVQGYKENGLIKRFHLKQREFYKMPKGKKGGKQYQVKEGDEIFVEKLDVEGEFTIDKVIMVGKDDGAVVGAPYVDGASVKASLIKNGKAKKVTVFTYKPKKSSKRKMGHRQPYSKIKIEAINA